MEEQVITSETETGVRRRTRAPRKSPVSRPSSGTTTIIPAEHTVDVGAFRDLGIGGDTLGAIAALGYSTPTGIQVASIPSLLAGRDLVGKAQTGTGKTLAFAIPIAERLDPSLSCTQAIVMVPTRELAMQVSSETERVCSARGLHVLALFGGRRVRGDMAGLAAAPHVVVGTPGRVIDHLQRGTLNLANVQVVVLDEADEMLDIGFADDIETILRRTPRQRQTALFSATIPPFIRRMVNRYLVNPVRVSIDPGEVTVAAIDQIYYEVSERDKLDGLLELLTSGEMNRVLCFRRTQIGVDRLAEQLSRRQVSACGIHGGMGQSERDRVMTAFRSGDLRVLIATNVAARGLDIPEVTHVVNFDLPQNTEEYVHRIGRTGRAGRAGTAMTFVGEWDLDGLDVLKRFVGESLRRGRLELYGGTSASA
jgi:ATP-dependent RNA helicase DeaD